jgi:hypothetical protein
MPLLPGFDWARFPTLNKSKQLAVLELVAHGGSPQDIAAMRAYFEQQAAEAEKPQSEIPET